MELENTKLPDEKETIEFIEWAKMPLNIKKHSLTVNLISQFLAYKISEANADKIERDKISININLVDKASILHDIFRVIDIKNWEDGYFEQDLTEEIINRWREIKARFNGMTHEEAAYEFFKEKYPLLAQTIRMHKFKRIVELNTIEEKIVTYADKRSKHNEIVSLNERFRDGRIRNRDLIIKQNIKESDIRELEDKYFELEREIFSIININPNNLMQEIDIFINSPNYHNWGKLLNIPEFLKNRT
jgi:HD superfamily phosphodiesterase